MLELVVPAVALVLESWSGMEGGGEEWDRVVASAVGWGEREDEMFLDIWSRWPKDVLGVCGGLRETRREVRRGIATQPFRSAERKVEREGHPKHR